VGDYAGEGGVDFYVDASRGVGVFGVYNDTRVATIYDRADSNGQTIAPLNGSVFAVSDGSYQAVTASNVPEATGRVHILANKPIAVVSLDPTNAISYEHTLPGRPLMPRIILGHAEF